MVKSTNPQSFILQGGAYRSDPAAGAVAVPIYQRTSYRFRRTEHATYKERRHEMAKLIGTSYRFRGTEHATDKERRHEMAKLIGACAAGDRRAFRRLYDLSSRFVCGIILAVLRDKEMAAEVAQEVFASIWWRADSFDDEESNPLAWIAAIARNRAIDRLRVERIRSFIVAADELPDIADDRAPVELLVEAVAARRALADLRPEFRRALELSYFMGYTSIELAGALDVPVGTAKSWVRRGLAALKRALE